MFRSTIRILVVLAFLPLMACLPALGQYDPWQIMNALQHRQPGLTLVTSHRGEINGPYATNMPENSVGSALNAIDGGIEMIEADVWTTQDHIPYLAHDKTTYRMLNMQRRGYFNPDPNGTPAVNWSDISGRTLCAGRGITDVAYGGSGQCTLIYSHVQTQSSLSSFMSQVLPATNAQGQPWGGVVLLDIRDQDSLVQAWTTIVNNASTPQQVVFKFSPLVLSLNSVQDLVNLLAASPYYHGQTGNVQHDLAAYMNFQPTYITNLALKQETATNNPNWAIDNWNYWLANAGSFHRLLAAEVSVKGYPGEFITADKLYQTVTSGPFNAISMYSGYYECYDPNGPQNLPNLPPGGTSFNGYWINDGLCNTLKPSVAESADGIDHRYDYNFITGHTSPNTPSITSPPDFGMIIADNAFVLINYLNGSGQRKLLRSIQPHCNSGSAYPGCDDRGQSTYTLCAPEGGTCTFTGDRNIMFGANGSYRPAKTFTNTAACNTTVFGDPLDGVVKACYYSPPISNYSYNRINPYYAPTYCADEGQSCNWTEPVPGSFGVMSANDAYTADYTNHTLPGYLCNTSTFVQGDPIKGDPAPGFRKACFYVVHEQYVLFHPGPQGYSFCSGQNGLCAFKGLGRIAYGSGQNFGYKVFDGGVACNDSVLADTNPGKTKDCWYETTTAVNGATGSVTPAPPEQPQPQTRSNPQPGAFMNDAALLGNVDDSAWYLSNIPFFEIPDQQIQQVYYYRWQTYKEHLVYTSPIYGWLSTEFLAPASYGAPYGGINAAAGHQTTEGRWLRNQQYVKNNINYWLNGPGQFAKPQDYNHNPDTTDWAHEYSYWAASSVWQTLLATGDAAFATSLLPQLVNQYRGWDNHFNSQLGLYWQVPVWDATEFTPASYGSSDPYHGGAGYRPTINSYQYGDAQAIAQIANLAGNSALASEYTQRASALQAATMTYLWDPSRNFFYHMNRDNNPTNALLDTREEEGFVPWMFELPQPVASSAMAELLDPSGFQTAYGPPTAEKRSSWYMYQASGCCHWDGPSWPYETSQTLTGLANLLIDYPRQPYVNANDYVDLLHTYAATQYKNGAPYVAEAHDPDNNNWIYDTSDHSEDYNHSTYVDNVISGLIGLRGQPDNTLLISPLVPPSWDYFALENTPYHGHNVTVLWDRLGTRYGQGTGLSVFVDNNSVLHQSTLDPVRINVGSAITQAGDGLFNVAVNSQRAGYGPQPIASYVFAPEDSIWNGIDGIVYRSGIPENSRWTTYQSPNTADYYGVNFQHNVSVQEVRLTFYDDGGGTRVPASYVLQYLNNSNVWTNIAPVQGAPAPNALTSVKFAPLTTARIRVVASNTSPTQGWGISELQAMSTSPGATTVTGGWYQIVNVNSNKLMGVHNEYPFDGAQIQQYEDDKTPDHLWSVEDQGNGYFKIRNLASNLFLGVDQESTTDSALVKQAQDNGTPDHLWQFIYTNGVFKILNKNSGLLLGVDQESTANSANMVQFHDNGTPDHLWIMSQVPDPNFSVTYKYMNYNSSNVLAVGDESLADGAQIQQYSDNQGAVNYYLTPDHLWEKDDQGGGYYILRNVMSNLVLGVDQESKADSALIKQAQNNGTPDHYWQFVPQFTIPNSSGSGTIQCSAIKNYNSGLLLGVDGESKANSANIFQFHDNGTPDHDWCEFPIFFDPRNRPVYKIVNVNSNELLAVQNALTSDGAQIQQYSDTGTADHVWQLENAGGGYFKILNLRSNLVLGVDQESKADSALIKQAQDNGTPDHLWQFVNVGNDQFKIQNKLSGLLLGVDQMSLADSANVVQFHDSGTADHLWKLQATGWPTRFP